MSGRSLCVFLKRLFLECDVEPEGTANARFAFHADLPAHHFDQLLADRQPQTRTAVFARGGTIRLGEAFENGGLPFVGNADAGILHRKVDLDTFIRLFDRFGADDDLALVGEFDGIAQPG